MSKNKFFKTRQSIVWLITTSITIVLLTVLTILASTMFYDIISNVLGKGAAITASGTTQVFETEFNTKEEARLNGNAVNEELFEEGIVLLKNDSNALPIATGSSVSVFGKNSVDLVYGGSGSGAGSGANVNTLFESLDAVGISYNPALVSFYEDDDASGSGRPSNPQMDNNGIISLWTGETPWSSYDATLRGTFSNYDDAAIIVISRIGGEGFDLPRTMSDNNGDPVEGARNADDHYLQLDQNETDLIAEVTAAFDKVIIVINSSTQIELGFLDDTTHYAYNANIDAALWIGAPGDTGIMSLGRILTGEVNPSGRTVDTWVRDYKEDPTWQNFGNNLEVRGERYTSIANQISSYLYAFVDYEEGIYMGYRYYETRGETDGEIWYDDHVVYPFGYGLSYTTFTQEITNSNALEGDSITANETFEIDVEVTNTGTVAGKDTVMIYVTTPYNAGEIEKSHVVLVGFAKTGDIAPSESETVTIEIDPYSFASYDYNDANSNSNEGYELDAGTYTFRLGINAHDEYENFTMNVAADILFENDTTTNNEVVNRFDDADDELTIVLSRNDWDGTFPSMRTAAEKIISAATNTGINSVDSLNPNTYTEFPLLNEEGTLTLQDLVDADFDDPQWEELISQLSGDDLIDLFNKGAFQTIALLNIGKPQTTDADGPAGFVNFLSTGTVYGTSHYGCEPIMAATFNVELLYKFGEAVGDEGLIGNEDGDGIPYSGWYSPGVNLHRSPFGGRTGEYFSEDPFLTGIMASHEIQGAMSKGVYTFVKHFAVNEQETSRSGVATWLDEQTLREIYLKPFEYTVKVGQTTGMMSSFNRIGTKWAGGDYRLLTEVLREEWGFQGAVISDFNTGSHMDSKQMAYAGGDINLQTLNQEFNASKSSVSDMSVLANGAKNILYMVTNSNAMNTEVLGYRMPVWMLGLVILDAVSVAGFGTWGFFIFRKR